MQFLYDNHGPYLKIYFNDNNVNSISNDYELFERSQNDLPNFSRDGLNNFHPNTQAQLPFNSSNWGMQSVPSKNPSIQSSVIHHLVSSLGPNKTGSYSPFGETIVNNSSPAPVNNSFTNILPASASTVPHHNPNILTFGDVHTDLNPTKASVESPNSSSSNINNVMPAANVKKTRIVAEVKPMRMSYSDVVSKNGAIGQEPINPTVGSTNSASSSPNTTLPATTPKSVKHDKSKFSSGNFDKKVTQDADQIKAKKSPINTSVNSSSGNPVDSKKNSVYSGKADKPIPGQSGSSRKRTFLGTSKEASGNKASPNQTGNLQNSKGKLNSDSDDDENDNSSILESDDDIEDFPNEFYNVRKNIYHGEHHNIEKIITTKGSSMNFRKVKTASSGVPKKVEKSQKRAVKSTSRKRQKHEVLLKLCLSWSEYLMKFLLWLWTLVYDVGYLSCGILWDRLIWCYQYIARGFETLRDELNGSPGKALWLWMKNLLKTFDGKFDKKSRWAFWRWLFKKKQPTNDENKDYYKDGKLPKTAEEAMKSLLNCKGKDAYR